MRTIKFRAWDKKRNIMIGNDYPNNWMDDNHDEWWDDINKMELTSIEDIANDDNFIVEQFTGLLDKNGKEIYEGDIVLWAHKHFKEWDLKGEIIFHAGSFKFFPSLVLLEGFGINESEYEVIGTIHDKDNGL